ncbi:hypothetical protein ILYODFUR_010906 [Ilyodon furcidens]|uniref:Uncharacterized protein n=1 Tax=Ilyodon furcidens TaxID=33524 RepID=A0ABV0TK56_9TELE
MYFHCWGDSVSNSAIVKIVWIFCVIFALFLYLLSLALLSPFSPVSLSSLTHLCSALSSCFKLFSKNYVFFSVIHGGITAVIYCLASLLSGPFHLSYDRRKT